MPVGHVNTVLQGSICHNCKSIKEKVLDASLGRAAWRLWCVFYPHSGEAKSLSDVDYR